MSVSKYNLEYSNKRWPACLNWESAFSINLGSVDFNVYSANYQKSLKCVFGEVSYRF